MKIIVIRKADEKKITLHVFVRAIKGSCEWKDKVFWAVVHKLIRRGWLVNVPMHSEWSGDNLSCHIHNYTIDEATEDNVYHNRYHTFNRLVFMVVSK